MKNVNHELITREEMLDRESNTHGGNQFLEWKNQAE